VKINTSRFGELEVRREDILTLNDGLLGFENLKKFFVVDPGDSTLILWMQSTEDANVAFPMIEPKIFKPDYVAKLLPSDLNALQLESVKDAKIYTVLTIPKDVTKMTANLKAPIVINSTNKTTKQIILQDSKLPVQFEMYMELKKYIVAYNSDDSKRTTVEISDQQEETKKPAVSVENTVITTEKELN
jgi:flagellar assembly factor FliW